MTLATPQAYRQPITTSAVYLPEDLQSKGMQDMDSEGKTGSFETACRVVTPRLGGLYLSWGVMTEPSNNPKKPSERRLFTGFRQRAGLDLKIVEERESPDFLLAFEGRTIGLEVTELFVPSSGESLRPQARSSIGARLADRAKILYRQLGGKPVHVSIGLTPQDELRHLNRNQAAAQLAQFMLALDPPLDQVIFWRHNYLDDSLPREISFLNILAVPSWDMAHWHTPEAGWVAPLDESLLQAAVAEKANKLPEYQKAAQEVWLLLATGGRSASQFFEISPTLRTEDIQTPFSRTYYYAGFEGRVLRLGGSV
ncbi:MAG: hypothetical protein ABW110_05200 [Steroidobacteraceae bacterium]